MERFWFHFFCLLSLGLFSTKLSEGSLTEENEKTLEKLLNSLKFNETCSWRNEKLRLLLLKDHMTLTDREKFNQNEENLSQRVIREEMQFCSMNIELVCDRLTKRCRCGNRWRELFARNATDIPDYVLEADANGEERCRWAEGSYCFYPLTSDRDANTKCQAGTVCTYVGNGSPCNFDTLLRHISPNPNLRRHYRDIFRGRVCTCIRLRQQESVSPN